MWAVGPVHISDSATLAHEVCDSKRGKISGHGVWVLHPRSPRACSSMRSITPQRFMNSVVRPAQGAPQPSSVNTSTPLVPAMALGEAGAGGPLPAGGPARSLSPSFTSWLHSRGRRGANSSPGRVPLASMAEGLCWTCAAAPQQARRCGQPQIGCKVLRSQSQGLAFQLT